jgi:hypothetical protein
MSNIIPISDMTVMADSIVKSGFYGFKNKEQVMAVMLVAQAENKHPATVVQEYDIIQGRPALKSQAILARFQLAGGTVQWDVVSPKAVKGTFKHPSGGTLTVEWTIDMAKQAGLVREGSGWSKYPEDMLRARVISRAVRSVFPACILGHYATEEVMDFDPPKQMGKVDIVQPVVEVLEVKEPTGSYHIIQPDGNIYSSHENADEWIEAYGALLKKIMDSPKLTNEVKQEKVKALAEANLNVTTNFDSFQKLKIRAALSTAGVSQNPKPEAPPFNPDSELNEQPF